jgi:hypothetical protein
MKGTNEQISVKEFYEMFSENENKLGNEDATAETQLMLKRLQAGWSEMRFDNPDKVHVMNPVKETVGDTGSPCITYSRVHKHARGSLTLYG